MFERFSEAARQAVLAAQDEARNLRHGQIDSEHLLLGLLRDEDSLAARALASLEVTLERARVEIVQRVSPAESQPTSGQIPFTPRATQVLERAEQEGMELGHNYVGSEHLLLGITAVDDGVGMSVLRDLGLDAETIRGAVIRLLSGPGDAPLRRSRCRGATRRIARASPAEESMLESGIRVDPAQDVVRLLMSAAARALEDGRTEMTASDLLISLSRDEQTAPVLAGLGAGEAAIRAALARRGTSQRPPEAAAGD